MILKFSGISTCRPLVIYRRDFSCPDSCLGNFYSCWKFVGFLTTLYYSLKEAQQLFFFEKHIQRTWKPPTIIFRSVGYSWIDWGQNPKVGGPKIGKVWRGLCRVLGPVFLEYENQRVRCKKTFENSLSVSGSRLNVSEYDLKQKWPQ